MTTTGGRSNYPPDGRLVIREACGQQPCISKESTFMQPKEMNSPLIFIIHIKKDTVLLHHEHLAS